MSDDFIKRYEEENGLKKKDAFRRANQ